MKVVHLCTMDSGGAGKAAARLNQGLRSMGVDSTMVVLTRRGADPAVRRLPSQGPLGMLRDLVKPSARRRAVSRGWDEMLRAYPRRPPGLEIFTGPESRFRIDASPEVRAADIVHLHWVAGLLDYPSAPDRLRDKKVVWTLHDMNPFTGGCHYAAGCERYRESCGACPQLGSTDVEDLSRRIWDRKNEAYKRMAIQVVTPSRWLAGCASRSGLMGGFRVVPAPNGVPTQVYRPSPRAQARRAVGLPESKRVILFGADYDTRRKGFHLLMEALDRFPESLRDDVLLAFFGALVEPPPGRFRTASFGAVSDERQLALIYSAADVFVIPSLEDNFPNTVLEALACGVPVAGFAVGGIAEMVEDGVAGKLASPGSVAGLADAIRWTLETRDSESIAGECRRRAEREFDIAVQARRYLALYRDMFAGS